MNDHYTQWRASLRSKQKKRTYKHFDNSLDLNSEQDFMLVKRTIENLSNHQFLPFLKFIKKDIRYRKDKNGVVSRSIKPRPIMYASHLDAHIYGFYSYMWGKSYENFLNTNNIADRVIAYRKIADNSNRNKGNIQFARDVFEYIQEQGDCVVIVADISKFFDTLKHKTLKERLCTILGVDKLNDDEYKVFKSLSIFRFVLKDKIKNSKYFRFMSSVALSLKKGKSLPQAVYEFGKILINTNKTEVGIPQGSPASGLLANIYLSGFDLAISNSFQDILYRRYSDDIILVCPVDIADDALNIIKTEIKKYSLDINTKKAFFVKFERQADGGVVCVDVKDGDKNPVTKKYIDYLGFEFDGESVLLRGKTLQKTYKKADKNIHKYKLRQTKDYKHKSRKNICNKKGGMYINNAMLAMESVGSKISFQKNKLDKFIRRSRKKAEKIV